MYLYSCENLMQVNDLNYPVRLHFPSTTEAVSPSKHLINNSLNVPNI